jgi:dihydrolipoamide dehydrogenase
MVRIVLGSSCDYDVLILGGGIGGYPAAVKLSRRGFRVAVVNDGLMGGECTNYGCIPTKALIKFFERGSPRGLVGADIWRSGIGFALESVEKSRKGICTVLTSYVVTVINGRGVFAGERNGCYWIRIGESLVSGGKVLVATGSSPVVPNVIRGLQRVLDNRSILRLDSPPRSVLVLGGGAVGVEYARILSSAGVRVVLVEMMKNVLPTVPRDLSKQVLAGLEELGVEVHTSTLLEEAVSEGDAVRYKLSSGDVGVVDYVFNATGRKPNTRGLGLEEIGVEVDDKGHIKVNERMETTAPGVYAVGDVVGPPLLAHKAYYQSLVAAENIAGGDAVFDSPVPMVVFSYPEVVWVGYSWGEARKAGFKASRKRVPLNILTRSFIEGWDKGYARIVYDDDTGVILGFEMAGPSASELAGLASLLVSNKITLSMLTHTVFPHPTMSEVFRELEEAARGEPIHTYTPVRKA